MGPSTQASKKKIKCQMQFDRTVKRTGKWRGIEADQYKKYQKRKKVYNPYESKEFIKELKRESDKIYQGRIKSGKIKIKNKKYATSQFRPKV